MQARKIFTVLFVEAIQNIPLIAGLVGGLSLWRQNLLAAIVCMSAGSILSALIMIPTEARVFEGHRESGLAVITNIVTFTSLMLVYAIYLHAGWSSWRTDIVGGLIAGILLGTAQDLAAKERFSIVRNLTLALSCAVSLVIIRSVVGTWSPLISIAIITVLPTLAMAAQKLWRIRQLQDDRTLLVLSKDYPNRGET